MNLTPEDIRDALTGPLADLAEALAKRAESAAKYHRAAKVTLTASLARDKENRDLLVLEAGIATKYPSGPSSDTTTRGERDVYLTTNIGEDPGQARVEFEEGEE